MKFLENIFKPKFHYNKETLAFEKVHTPIKQLIRQILIHLASSIISGIAIFLLYINFIESPQEKVLKQENSRMKLQYSILEKKLNSISEVMVDLMDRDNNLYRAILQAEPIPIEQRISNLGNSKRYEEFESMANATLLKSVSQKVDNLGKQVYVQSRSYDQVVDLFRMNDIKLQHIPAIQPVLNKDLTRIASGFGMRIDPVYGVRRMHEGMDFTAPVGTDVFATGSGTISRAGWEGGYGNCIDIDHGFGYKTRYGHLHKINVKKGQKVNRGEVIGTVGNTGKSTGPHLHYETHFNGKKVNPKNYFFLDLSPEEYDKMVQMADNNGKMMD